MPSAVASTVTAGQVTDPGTGEPGVGVRFLDGDGTLLAAEHRLAGKLIWTGREIVAGTHEFVFTWPGDARDTQQIEVQAGKPSYVIGQRP